MIKSYLARVPAQIFQYTPALAALGLDTWQGTRDATERSDERQA